jgi:two-component system, response regulator PdtaR
LRGAFYSMSDTTLYACILVVEDESLIRMHVVCLLEDEGFAVLEAQHGAEAISVLAKHPDVSLLVTDVRMPGQPDGLGLVRHARENYPHIRSVVVSGDTSEVDALSAGAMRFIPKPYLPTTIVSAVRELLKAA